MNQASRMPTVGIPFEELKSQCNVLIMLGNSGPGRNEIGQIELGLFVLVSENATVYAENLTLSKERVASEQVKGKNTHDKNSLRAFSFSVPHTMGLQPSDRQH